MLAFVHIAKTGGQTISLMLRSACGIRHCDVLPWEGVNGVDPFQADDLRRVKKLHPPLRSIAGHSIMLFADLETIETELQYLAFVREPIARATSMYQFRVLGTEPNLEFDEWLGREVHHNHQTKMLAGNESVEDAIRMINSKKVFIGLKERFDESLVMFKRLFAPDMNIAYESRNIARDNQLAKDLLSSAKTRGAIAQVYQSDLELYDYITNEVYSQYRREYGDGLAEDVAKYQRNRSKLNRTNVLLNRMYRNLVYKPALRLNRRRSNWGATGASS